MPPHQWAVIHEVEYLSTSQAKWIKSTVIAVLEDGKHLDLKAKKNTPIKDVRLPVGEVGPALPVEIDEATGVYVGVGAPDATAKAAYFNKLEGRFQKLRALYKLPHVAFLSKVFGLTVREEDSCEFCDGVTQADTLAACGVSGDDAQKALEVLSTRVLQRFPKVTKPGDTHSYAQFAVNPPAAQAGTVHIVQVNPWMEPMFGSDWGPIVMLVHDLLSGKLMVDKLKIAPVAPGPLCMSPSLYGWVADGAPANAYKLAALWALVLCILEDDEAPPPEVSDWLRMFSIISVTHTRHASSSAKVGQIKKSQRN